MDEWGRVAFQLDEWSEWVDYIVTPGEVGSPVEPDRDWVWREDRMQTLLSTEDADIMFVSGCTVNMKQFLPQFDRIILLSAGLTVSSYYPDYFRFEWQAFARNLLTGKSLSPSILDGYHTACLTEAICRSLRNGGAMTQVSY